MKAGILVVSSVLNGNGGKSERLIGDKGDVDTVMR